MSQNYSENVEQCLIINSSILDYFVLYTYVLVVRMSSPSIAEPILLSSTLTHYLCISANATNTPKIPSRYAKMHRCPSPLPFNFRNCCPCSLFHHSCCHSLQSYVSYTTLCCCHISRNSRCGRLAASSCPILSIVRSRGQQLVQRHRCLRPHHLRRLWCRLKGRLRFHRHQPAMG